jgi:hypothetical protein
MLRVIGYFAALSLVKFICNGLSYNKYQHCYQKISLVKLNRYIHYMIKDTLKNLFIRDLEKLKLEIAAYQNEAKLWYIEKDILNSAGNLCLHLVGNLNTYIGAEFGKTGYVRNREDEFALKDISRAELITKVEKTIVTIGESFDMITEDQLNEKYPAEIFVKDATTGYFFVHLAMHLGYHLGQINYHRRLLDN